MNINSKKRGAPKGRRAFVWICEGVLDGKLVSNKYSIKDPQNNNNMDLLKKSAESEFINQFGIVPEKIWGPMYDKKMPMGNKTTKSKSTDSRDFSNVKLSSKNCRNAVYRGWKGLVFDIENQCDKAMFVFTSEVSVQNGKARPAPSATKVNLVDLHFIDEKRQMIINS